MYYIRLKAMLCHVRIRPIVLKYTLIRLSIDLLNLDYK